MNIILALIVGGIYLGVGRHASKALFNFGFMFTIVIAYLYLPMMPVLLQCNPNLYKGLLLNNYELSNHFSSESTVVTNTDPNRKWSE